MAKSKKKPLKAKYVARRFFLTLILLAAVGVGGWFGYTRLWAVEPPAKPVVATPAVISEPEPTVSVEPEPTPEPEPEPEVRPVGASLDDWELRLANPDNYLPDGYAPPELEIITGTYGVDKRIADSVKRMFAQAKQDGISLIICSAYRPQEKQQELFDQKTQEFIATGQDEKVAAAAAATIVARPGSSEHQTGLALDIVTSTYMVLDAGFEDTPAFKWLDENAHKYGFVLRYPLGKNDITKIIYEPWHYRYVGEENARIIKDKGFCLEEYLEFLKKARDKALADAYAPSSGLEESEPDTESSSE